MSTPSRETLQVEQQTPLHSHNDTHLIGVLPPEVLATIFKSMCPLAPQDLRDELPPPRNVYPLLTLTHVSSYWRRVTWSTPHLWNTISITIDPQNVHSVLEILRLHFQNSRRLPFSLDLDFNGGSSYYRRTVFWRTMKDIEHLLFITHSANIRTVRFNFVPVHWLSLISTHFHNLRRLLYSHDFNKDPNIDISLEAFDCLHHFALEGLHGIMTLPWASITQLELRDIPFDQCVKALILCVKLTKFESFYPTTVCEATNNAYFPNSTTHFRYIRALTWSSRPECLLYLVVLEHIRLPALEELSWIGDCWEPDDIDIQVRSFFSDLPNTVRTLYLECPGDWSTELFTYVFTRTPGIRELTLYFYDIDIIEVALCALYSNPVCGADEQLCLPLLTSLTIQGIRWTKVLDAGFSQQIVEICRGRRLGPRLHIKFEHVGLTWAPGVREEMNAMARQGLGLEVVDSSGKVVPL